MNAPDHLISKIFDIKSDDEFQAIALEVFRYQYIHNSYYKLFCDYLNRKADQVKHITDIPFMPVSFFRNFVVLSSKAPVQAVFSSSGTTDLTTSRHLITNLSLYEQSFTNAFRYFYGDPEQYCLLALLPSYLERKESSLVYMAEKLIQQTKHKDSGFYLYEYEALAEKLMELKKAKQASILLGVTYALLDMATQYPIDFPELIVMETGGMKGRRKEMIRQEVHEVLKNGFGVSAIHSEYGMTELLSQAYSKGDGIFLPPPWMRILIRDTYDPFSIFETHKSGGINIIDLANIHSCAFIEIQDLGKIHNNKQFEVLGRYDNSLARGCNLLVAN